MVADIKTDKGIGKLVCGAKLAHVVVGGGDQGTASTSSLR